MLYHVFALKDLDLSESQELLMGGTIPTLETGTGTPTSGLHKFLKKDEDEVADFFFFFSYHTTLVSTPIHRFLKLTHGKLFYSKQREQLV